MGGCATAAPDDTSETAGAGGPTAPAGGIQDIVWQWESVANRTSGEVTTVPDPASYTITFRRNGNMNGQADCNSFAGTYSQDSGFHITLGAVTEAYCGEDSLDARYLELLAEVVAGGPDGAGGFALETAGGAERMQFANGGPAPAE